MVAGATSKFICIGDVGNPAGQLSIESWDAVTNSYKRELTSRVETAVKQCTNIQKILFKKFLKPEMNGTLLRCMTTFIDVNKNKKTLYSSEEKIMILPGTY